MELLTFVTCAFLLSNRYYYLLVTFLTSSIIFEWTIEKDDKIFEDKLALTFKNTCLSINKYNNIAYQFSVYKYLNTKFLVITNIIKKSLTNKMEKIYMNIVIKNVENNYDKMIMSCLGNISNFVEPSKFNDKKLNNVDDQIKKYISAFKKTSQ